MQSAQSFLLLYNRQSEREYSRFELSTNLECDGRYRSRYWDFSKHAQDGKCLEIGLCRLTNLRTRQVLSSPNAPGFAVSSPWRSTIVSWDSQKRRGFSGGRTLLFTCSIRFWIAVSRSSSLPDADAASTRRLSLDRSRSSDRIISAKACQLPRFVNSPPP